MERDPQVDAAGAGLRGRAVAVVLDTDPGPEQRQAERPHLGRQLRREVEGDLLALLQVDVPEGAEAPVVAAQEELRVDVQLEVAAAVEVPRRRGGDDVEQAAAEVALDAVVRLPVVGVAGDHDAARPGHLQHAQQREFAAGERQVEALLLRARVEPQPQVAADLEQPRHAERAVAAERHRGVDGQAVLARRAAVVDRRERLHAQQVDVEELEARLDLQLEGRGPDEQAEVAVERERADGQRAAQVDLAGPGEDRPVGQLRVLEVERLVLRGRVDAQVGGGGHGNAGDGEAGLQAERAVHPRRGDPQQPGDLGVEDVPGPRHDEREGRAGGQLEAADAGQDAEVAGEAEGVQHGQAHVSQAVAVRVLGAVRGGRLVQVAELQEEVRAGGELLAAQQHRRAVGDRHDEPRQAGPRVEDRRQRRQGHLARQDVEPPRLDRPQAVLETLGDDISELLAGGVQQQLHRPGDLDQPAPGRGQVHPRGQ